MNQMRLALVLLALAGGLAARAVQTNAPAASTNVPGKPVDYRAMLQKVRLKQQEHNSLEEIQTAIRAFQMRVGRLPGDLSELVERGLLPEMPPPPPGTRFVYDRVTGNVRAAVFSIATPASAQSNLPGSANLVMPH